MQRLLGIMCGTVAALVAVLARPTRSAQVGRRPPARRRRDPARPPTTASPRPTSTACGPSSKKAVTDKVLPGVSLLLAHKGEVLFKQAFGTLMVAQAARIASGTRPITMAAVVTVVDDGKLGLDDLAAFHGGPPRTFHHGGALGTMGWADVDRELVGVFFSQAGLAQARPIIQQVQQKVRTLTPAHATTAPEQKNSLK